MKHYGKKTEQFPEGNIYLWAAAEPIRGESRESARLWRHGRFHVRLPGKGRRRFYERVPGDKTSRQPDWGKRGELGLDLQWYFLPLTGSSFGIGAQFKWGTNASETTPDISLYFGRLGSVWIHLINVVPYRWLERWTPATPTDRCPVWSLDVAAERPHGMFVYNRPGKEGTWKVDYDSRVFNLRFTWNESLGIDPTIRWEFWNRDGHWARKDPWWMHGRFSFKDFILGGSDFELIEEPPTDTHVPMPEALYPAKCIVGTYTWSYRRPIGRLKDRVFGKRTRRDVRIEVPGGVPVPGKGENSWDCGDDAIYSTGGRSPTDAIANLVRSALRARDEYGGKHMSVPGYKPPAREQETNEI